MSFDKAVEAIIQEAMERGEFDDLPGKGKPIDLSAYFDTPEDMRAAYSILKNAGMVPHEVELLQEIAQLKQLHSALRDVKRKREVLKQIRQKQLEFSLMIERNHKKNDSRIESRRIRSLTNPKSPAILTGVEVDFHCHLSGSLFEKDRMQYVWPLASESAGVFCSSPFLS